MFCHQLKEESILRYLRLLCKGCYAKVVDKLILQKECSKDIIKKQAYEDWKKVSNVWTDEGRYVCKFQDRGQTFCYDGKMQLDHEKESQVTQAA